MPDFLRLRRSLAQVLLGDREPASARRVPSFPFISGDTYRAACDLVIETPEDLKALDSTLGERQLVFCSMDMLAMLLTTVDDESASRIRLVVHNGDLLPQDLLRIHASRFQSVFAVNWTGDRRLVQPLPIGLENAWIGVNGDLSLFRDCGPAQRAALLRAHRSRQVLLAFNDRTCPEVRGAARAAFQESGLDVDTPVFMHPRDYHARLRDSLFVPSPRGNGVDCHRTWEAIYTGAVPVVLRSDWPFEHLDLPVLVVDAWPDAVQAIAQDPSGLYSRIVAKPAHAAFAAHSLCIVADAR